MRRVLACLAVCGVVATSSIATAVAQPAPAADRIRMLGGTFACRTLAGSTVAVDGASNDSDVDVVHRVVLGTGEKFTLHDHFTFDPAAARWRAVLGGGTPLEIRGDAPRWTQAEWIVDGHAVNGTIERVRYVLAGATESAGFRRIIEAQTITGSWVETSASSCVPGSVPPPASACIGSTVPARIVKAAVPARRDIPPETPHGTVRILVHLDADAHVVSTTTIESPSPYLTAAAVAAINVTTFAAGSRDCAPVASDVLYTAVFTAGRVYVSR